MEDKINQLMSELESKFVHVNKEYRLLTSDELAKIRIGRKTLKTNGQSEYVYIDNPHISKKAMSHLRGTNFTPKKKKRK